MTLVSSRYGEVCARPTPFSRVLWAFFLVFVAFLLGVFWAMGMVEQRAELWREWSRVFKRYPPISWMRRRRAARLIDEKLWREFMGYTCSRCHGTGVDQNGCTVSVCRCSQKRALAAVAKAFVKGSA